MASSTRDRQPCHTSHWSNIQRLVFKRQENTNTNAGHRLSTSMEEGLLRPFEADDSNEPDDPSEPDDPTHVLGEDDNDESNYGEELSEENMRRAGLGPGNSEAARDSTHALPTVATIGTESDAAIEMTATKRNRRNRSSRARNAGLTEEERAEYARLRHARVRETTRAHTKHCVDLCTSIGDCWDGCGDCCIEKCQVCCWSFSVCFEDLGYECDPAKACKSGRGIFFTLVFLLALSGTGFGIWKLVDLTHRQPALPAPVPSIAAVNATAMSLA